MHILDYSTTLAALLLTTANLASAEPIPVPAVQLSQPNHDLILSPRARPNAPSGGYAPQEVNCPRNKPTVRLADGISKQEEDWLGKRRKETVKPMIDFLKRANLEGFDAEAYINRVAPDVKDLPNVGIAVSGGGYRALMNGAGFVAAADSRTTGATGEGQIGGLLQSSTYLAGLSGGGWLVSSIYTNNFSTVETLRNGREGSSIWKFDRSIFIGPNLPGIFDTTRYWSRVARQVAAKADAGFETSITDYWGRALGYQLIDAEDGGPAYTFSSIALDDEFSAARTPFPILVANGRYPGERIISLNATVYEFNPYEMGSYDPTTYGFVPMEYLGSNFSQGVIPSSGKCVKGFDSVSYIYGTSSSLFNAFMLQNISSVEGVPTFLLNAANATLNILDSNENDIAQYEPNPFLGWNNATNPSAQKIELDLVDGGLDLQNIPLHPLIQPFRHVDVIFAVDSSADTTHNWPNGTALRASWDRSQGAIANGTLFPPVPDQNTFINLGLNNRPTFFGCDVNNFTLEAGQKVPPLLVYIPNAPYSANSNVSTFTSSYPESQRNEIITNGYNAATQGNGTLDGEWNKCVACAVLSRSLARTGTGVPGECGRCFERYCWDGRLDTKAVEGEYEPGFRVGDASTKDSAAAGRAVVMETGMGLVVGLLGVVVMML
ncbi:Lysophospholipase 1 [Podospora bellae-mahoneyi]|uniref:Lysophospholipase n=1 Tax=Podospora bellae-mahoneyi TaxID=2093777 RepID=A0ABR0FY34_9PEZI|nr:Lysophospholipase 1 [Podospora bellae-mahoneyi]